MDDEQEFLNEPESQPNAAAEAFAVLSGRVAAMEERLDGRMAVMARALEHIAIEKQSIEFPDYSPTLAKMNGYLATLAGQMKAIMDAPAMQLTPETLVAQIVEAAVDIREQDAATIRQARKALEDAIARADRRERNARTVSDQKRFVMRVAGAAVAATILICSFLPGMIVRSLPDSWRLPERIAARTLHLDRWAAGERMLMTADPDRWEVVLRANRILQDNRDAVSACEKAAAKIREPVRCTVQVGR